MAEIGIRGRGGFTATAQALRQAVRQLPQEMQDALNDAAKPLIEAARKRAADTLPRHGGLGRLVAGSQFQVSPIRRTGQAGIRIHTSDHDKRLDTQGRLRHPVYGHDRWVQQAVTPGWFTKAMQAGEDEARRRLDKALDGLAKQIGDAR